MIPINCDGDQPKNKKRDSYHSHGPLPICLLFMPEHLSLTKDALKRHWETERELGEMSCNLHTSFSEIENEQQLAIFNGMTMMQSDANEERLV